MTSTDHETIKGSAVFSFEAESFLALERLKVGDYFGVLQTAQVFCLN